VGKGGHVEVGARLVQQGVLLILCTASESCHMLTLEQWVSKNPSNSLHEPSTLRPQPIN
jgi:hypothetical protein